MFSGTFSLCPLFEGSFPLLLSGVFCAVCCGAGRSLWKGRVGAGMAAGRTPPLSLRRAVGTVTLTHALARASSLPPSARTAYWCLWPPAVSLPLQGQTGPGRHPATSLFSPPLPPCCISLLPHAALSPASLLGEGTGCLAGLSELSRHQVPLTQVSPALTALLGWGCVCVVLGFPFPSKLCLVTPPTTRTLGSGQLAGGAVSTQCE